MNDLIERLRLRPNDLHVEQRQIIDEAADEIERLTAKLKQAKARVEELEEKHVAYTVEGLDAEGNVKQVTGIALAATEQGESDE